VAAHGEGFLAGGRLALRFRKPVYDGERVTVSADGDALAVTGPDGVLRASGTYGSGGQEPAGAYEDVPLPDALLPGPAAQGRSGPSGCRRTRRVRRLRAADRRAVAALRRAGATPACCCGWSTWRS
jgi:hypothetical protein